MILLEDMNELHKIDNTILSKFVSSSSRAGRPNDLSNLNNYFGISNNSKIYVDTLKRTENGRSIHTWKYVTEVILQKPEVAGVIVRSNKRQLLCILKRNGHYTLYGSDYAEELPAYRDTGLSSYGTDTSSLISVRNKMAALVKGFIEAHPKAKKNWDIMIIMKDNTIQDLQRKRIETKKDVELKPNEKGYSEYIKNLKDNLAVRLEKYVNDKMKNVQTLDELRDYINADSGIFVKKIKILGLIYELDDMSSNISRSNQQFDAVARYRIKQPVGVVGAPDYYYYLSEARRLRIRYALTGRQMKLTDIDFDGYSFEDGIDYIARRLKELKDR